MNNKVPHTLIPIRNLYYILCYAWNIPQQRNKILLNAEDCKSVSDLFARMLTNITTILLKRGLNKEYTEEKESLTLIKGKVLLTDSIKENLLIYKKPICLHDSLTSNTIINRILYSTIFNMLNNKTIVTKFKSELYKVFCRIPHIEYLPLSSQVFNSVKLKRNNSFYKLILNICYLYYNSLLPVENSIGRYQFIDFTRGDNMNYLFEEFLRNFYKKECSSEFSNINRQNISFNYNSVDSNDKFLLPIMQTDITLDDKERGRRIIIDAKYYIDTLICKKDYNQNKIRREHISQIESYLIHQEDDRQPYTYSTEGVLIYPKVDKTLNAEYYSKKHKHIIKVCTVDLDETWQNIEKRLKDIVSS